MTASSPPIVVALLAAPDVTAATLYGFHDTLCGARRDWEMVHGGSAASPFRPLVVSKDGRPFEAANGVHIRPDVSFAGCPEPDIVCITDLAVAPGAPLGPGYQDCARWIRERHAHGALIASACSGAALLALTGLLDGLAATSHWAYCDALRRQYPSVRWYPERGLVMSGEGQRIVMAGSGIAWHQLALALIARHAGAEAAMQVARINLFDWNLTSPIAYASLTRGEPAADPVIARCQQWLALNYQTESPVSQMAALSGLPERTFKRRFSQATGMSPIEYVHTLRLEEAKQMLEASDLPIEAIAIDVGYQDASFFGRLFKRQVALTPAQYRRRFGNLKRQLAQAESTTQAEIGSVPAR